MLGINKENLRIKLISRTIETRAGSISEKIDVTLNVEQAEYTRNALAKGIYARLFDHLVNVTEKIDFLFRHFQKTKIQVNSNLFFRLYQLE